MQRTNTFNHLAPRKSAGFSLVEILIALGIFAIGMAAIVSLFPAAAILQRETTQEVISEMAAQSAASIIDTQALTYDPPGAGRTAADLNSYHSSAASTNSAAIPFNSISPALMTARYPATDRSYPTALINGTDISDCDLHWVPFIQDLSGDPDNPVWVARLFILEADSRATYSGSAAQPAADPDTFPRVASVGIPNGGVSGNVFTTASAIDLDPGDIVMDSNGNSHVIEAISGTGITVLNSIAVTPNAPNTLWYAPKSGASSSPAVRVVTVEVDVVAP